MAGYETTLKLYYHTARHLRWEQVFYRLKKALGTSLPKPTDCPTVRKASGLWVDQKVYKARMIAPRALRLLNETGDFDHGLNWNSADRSALWLYNLHYFDDLTAEGAEVRLDWHKDLVDKWVIENKPMVGKGWEPYPSSLRIVNWIKWFLRTGLVDAKWHESLYLQCHVLERRLEWHLLGNHLFANAKALVFAGVYFEGPTANRWLKLGLSIIDGELEEQVLEDGGNFELSPMYHAIMLFDILDLINISRCYGLPPLGDRSDVLIHTAAKMLAWLNAMSHPDGEVSFFNDAAMGAAPTYKVLEEYAGKLGVSESSTEKLTFDHWNLVNLDSSGYLRLEGPLGSLILDCARIGPDYLPGHGHADVLSFELSVDGHRVLVNSGVSTYSSGPERQRQRETGSHNTVEVDGKSSSNVWGAFRVAERAYPGSINVRFDEDLKISCSHDGYRKLRGKVTHTREWLLRDKGMSISDVLTGRPNSAKAFYHFHPNVRVSSSGNKVTATLPNGRKLGMLVSGGKFNLEKYDWHPEFGISQEGTRVVVEFGGSCVSADFEMESM